MLNKIVILFSQNEPTVSPVCGAERSICSEFAPPAFTLCDAIYHAINVSH